MNRLSLNLSPIRKTERVLFGFLEPSFTLSRLEEKDDKSNGQWMADRSWSEGSVKWWGVVCPSGFGLPLGPVPPSCVRVRTARTFSLTDGGWVKYALKKENTGSSISVTTVLPSSFLSIHQPSRVVAGGRGTLARPDSGGNTPELARLRHDSGWCLFFLDCMSTALLHSK
jgi:hypothetical protein